MNYVIIAVLLMGGYLLLKSRGKQPTAASGFRSLSVDEAKKMIKDKAVMVLDVRTPMETASGTIANAKTINVASPSFTKEVNALDKAATYIVYCRSGRRSANACNIMAKEGFENIYNLTGGYSAWK